MTFSINGYTHEGKDRGQCNSLKAEKGGGIVIYINKDLQYERRNNLETPDIESVWIEIKLRNS